MSAKGNPTTLNLGHARDDWIDKRLLKEGATVTKQEIMRHLDITQHAYDCLMVRWRREGRVTFIGGAGSRSGVWAKPQDAEMARERFKESVRERKLQRDRERIARLGAQDVSRACFEHRIVDKWVPAESPPGPRSVWDLA